MYIMGVVVYVAIVVFTVYVGFFLVEQFNIPRLVAIALTIPAVVVIAAIAVKGLLETRKWEKIPV
jgi:branched-subunit amino acid transport protein